MRNFFYATATLPAFAHKGTQLLCPGPIHGFGAPLKARRDSDSQPPPPPAGGYRFAPDPVQKSEPEKQKERKGKKIGAECFLSRAVGSLSRFQAQAAVSISSTLEQPERLRWREVRLPQTAGKRVIEKRG